DKINHIFKENSKFKDVIALYQFDGELKILLFDIIEKIESRENLLAQLPDNNETNADRLDILLRLGNLYWMNGELEKARGLLSSACVLARSIGSRDMQFRAYMGLGGVTYGLGVLEESTSAYQQAIKIDPSSFIPWLDLSIIYGKLGKTRRSIYAAKKATVLNPYNAEVWFTLGDIYFEKGRLADALPAYKNSLALDKKNACIWKRLGDVYQKTDHIPDAIAAFEKSAKLAPTDADALTRLAILYRNSGELQTALKLAQKAVKKAPADANNWITLGSILGVQERYLDAIAAYFQVVASKAPTPLAEISLADCFQKIGNTDQFLHWRSLAADRLAAVDDYAAACFYAISDDGRAALKSLRIAIRKKQVSINWLSQDPLFAAIRQDKRFQKLIQTQPSQ
ncbi:MAG: tetratricopeptide repeat protein, partial [Chloroflexi bacterium]|nr:tetratricopeptide repeat protein [Chloroflexota bacterium]